MTNENPINEGRHMAVLRNVQFGYTKTGSEQVVLGFELTEVHDPDCGRMIAYFGSLSENAIDFTVTSLRNCGWAGDDLSELPALADNGTLSREVELVVKHESYEGKLRVKVAWVNKPGGGRMKLERPLDENDISNLAKAMRSRIRTAGRKDEQKAETKGSSRQKSAPVHSAKAGSVSDDDLPF